METGLQTRVLWRPGDSVGAGADVREDEKGRPAQSNQYANERNGQTRSRVDGQIGDERASEWPWIESGVGRLSRPARKGLVVVLGQKTKRWGEVRRTSSYMYGST